MSGVFRWQLRPRVSICSALLHSHARTISVSGLCNCLATRLGSLDKTNIANTIQPAFFSSFSLLPTTSGDLNPGANQQCSPNPVRGGLHDFRSCIACHDPIGLYPLPPPNVSPALAPSILARAGALSRNHGLTTNPGCHQDPSHADARRATSCPALPTVQAADGGRQTSTAETETETAKETGTAHDPRGTRTRTKIGTETRTRTARHDHRTPPGNRRRLPPRIALGTGLHAERDDRPARTRQKLPPIAARCQLSQKWRGARRWAVREFRAIRHSQRHIARKLWGAKKTSPRQECLHTRQNRQMWAAKEVEKSLDPDMQVAVRRMLHQAHL